jgi:hypothetical protein
VCVASLSGLNALIYTQYRQNFRACGGQASPQTPVPKPQFTPQPETPDLSWSPTAALARIENVCALRTLLVEDEFHTCLCNLHAALLAFHSWRSWRMKPDLRISIGRCVPELLPVLTCIARALRPWLIAF